MFAEFLQVDGRKHELLFEKEYGVVQVGVGPEASLTEAELNNAIVLPHDDRVLVVDGFDGPCPYPEGPVFVWLTVAQHNEAKAFFHKEEWSGAPDPENPDNFWIDDANGERVCANCGARGPTNG